MKSLRAILLFLLVTMGFTGCRIFEVEDDLYDISREQANVWLQLFYVEHSADVAQQLPASYRIRTVRHTQQHSTAPTFVSARDGEQFTTTLPRTTDTLYYSGYMQPGDYRLLTYNEATGFEIDTEAAAVLTAGTSVIANPEPLFLGTWSGTLAAGETFSTGVYVRQRTRRVTFRLEASLSDTLSYVTCAATLSGVCYRLDFATDAIDPACQTTLPLSFSSVVTPEGDKTRVTLTSTVNLLSPSAYEYATMGLSHRLDVQLQALGPSGIIHTSDYSFDRALDEAYSADYAASTGDLNCIEAYTWQRTL